MEVVDKFISEANIVGINSGGGSNLWVCREAMESKYTNDSVFSSPKPLVTMECLAHILAGACKEGVQPFKLDDGEVDTKLTSRNMQQCIIWTKKIQKGGRALWEAHLHYGINNKQLLTPVLTLFAYLIHSCR